jgi:hypothetical protein
MSTVAKKISPLLLVVLAVPAAANVAAADDWEPYQPSEPQPTTTTDSHGRRIVVVGPVEPEPAFHSSLQFSGGVLAFTNDAVEDATDVGGLWEVRAVFGTDSLIALEAAYVGSAIPIETLFGPDQDATLIGTGFEGALRLNLAPGSDVSPFVFGGLGWKRYDVSESDFRTASTGIADEDTLMEIPFGGGFALRSGGVILDTRFTFRAAVGEDLVVDEDDIDIDGDGDVDAERMDNWAIAAGLGFEF